MKKIEEMTKEELEEALDKGKSWLIDHQQITETNKNTLGEDYNRMLFELGLQRLEELEQERIKRKQKKGV
jgi:hypothetical protein